MFIFALLDEEQRAKIAAAMENFRSRTCIRFVPRESHRDYVHVINNLKKYMCVEIFRFQFRLWIHIIESSYRLVLQL